MSSPLEIILEATDDLTLGNNGLGFEMFKKIVDTEQQDRDKDLKQQDFTQDRPHNGPKTLHLRHDTFGFSLSNVMC